MSNETTLTSPKPAASAAAGPSLAAQALPVTAAAAKQAAKEAKATRRAQAKQQQAGASGVAAIVPKTAATAAATAPQQPAPRFKPDGTPILSRAERKAKAGSDLNASSATSRSGPSGQAHAAGQVSVTASGSSKQTRQQQQQHPHGKAHAHGQASSSHPYPLASIASTLFGNVHMPPSRSLLSASLTQSLHRRTIHPSVLLLGTLLSTYQLTGANARAMAVLLALRDFVSDYKTPDGATLTRDLVTRLSSQIAFLKEARPLGTSVGHAIRYLKYEISVTDKDWDESTAKAHLLSRIDHFIRDRITYAGRVIQSHIGSKIRPGMTVLTYGRSSIVESTLLFLRRSGTSFNAIVIDSGRPLNEGQAMLATLSTAGIGKGGESGSLTFGPLSALSTLMPRADLVLLGTASLLSNGALYARAGTSLVAMTANELGKPVIAACETYKFSDRIQLDAFAGNEAGGAADLLADDSAAGSSDDHGLNSALVASAEADTVGTGSQGLSKGAALNLATTAGPLTIGQANKLRGSLQAVNLLYDITPPRFVTAVASEVGLSGPESVGVILRDYKSVLFGV
ncbi:nagb/rpia/CoA transferase-like protein [Tilletiaria anomala UBC 951]|uniref:Translation initiation factor eIF2B subunit delta n=1 Tax=Tilletiaria anomala (strain ATCC 24038 / CBS 436.72 / UBC 951) TaxID=1037660 RepID=A0A066W628_TILAU|nr:nagb/rpia/CoA transferase-like protein [Tilletiaria anomala UBC 951]KDN47993.1 nagb/rpia/CoA transferase-like protein [Tilletiaria anomala UBC 951]